MADTVDAKGVERVGLRVDRRGTGGRVGHELGDHRIAIDRDLPALLHTGVVTNGDAAFDMAFHRRAVFHETADRRRKVTERILSIEAHLHRPAGERHVPLLNRRLLAGRDVDHLLDEIDAGDEFGRRMLHLQAGVHLSGRPETRL
ncbi:hypothetical protein MesoLjLb_12990 [Mesorhizobium sp. L-8-3]|nr:hypothetical protein MesoLjLb_12990 [Mesorhizobium sp. L-8-3]